MAIYNLGQKTTAVVHQTALLAFTSGHVAAAGIKDISERSFVKGSCKFLLGASGLAYSAYHLYSYLYPEKKIEMQSFVREHMNEIEMMCKSKTEHGEWESFYNGASKLTYTHPDLPDYILKTERGVTSTWGNKENDLRTHFENAKYAGRLIQDCDFNRLIVPESYLLETNSGSALIEKKVDFIFWKANDQLSAQYRETALEQLKNFLNETGFCDINIDRSHNAYWTNDAKISLFDFDCRGIKFDRGIPQFPQHLGDK